MNKLLFAIIILIQCQLSLAKGIYSFVSDPFPPYVIGAIGDRGRVHGLVPWYIEEMMKEMKSSAYFEIMPWQRCKREVKEGNYDAIMQMRYSPERAKEYIFSKPYITSKFRLYYSIKKNPEFKKLSQIKELKGKEILATEGYYYGPIIENLEKNKEVEIVRTTFNEKNLEILLKERVDFFLSDSIVAEYYISNARLNNEIASLDLDLGDSGYSFAISMKSPLAAHINEINAMIDQYHKNKLIEKWLSINSAKDD